MLVLMCDMHGCKNIIEKDRNSKIVICGNEYDLCPECAKKVASFIKGDAQERNISLERKAGETPDKNKEASKNVDTIPNKNKMTALQIAENYGKEKLAEMYRSGKSSEELAKLVGITKTQMDNFFRKNNIRKRTNKPEDNTYSDKSSEGD